MQKTTDLERHACCGIEEVSFISDDEKRVVTFGKMQSQDLRVITLAGLAFQIRVSMSGALAIGSCKRPRI
jgi:hypothetical protein